jgi:hypothetical protein
MFSMTDIKAHTVYRIVMFVPNLILIALSIFAYPYVSYMVGFSFADSLVMKVLLSIVAYFVLAIVWTYLVKAASFVLNELFYLLIDVSPSKGLSDEESKAVLFGGQLVLDHLEFDRNIRNVSHQVVDRMSKQGLLGFIFKEDVSKRLWAVVDYYQKHPNESVTAYKAKQVVKELGIEQPWYEATLNNAYVRNMILQSIFFLYLLIEQPSI